MNSLLKKQMQRQILIKRIFIFLSGVLIGFALGCLTIPFLVRSILVN